MQSRAEYSTSTVLYRITERCKSQKANVLVLGLPQYCTSTSSRRQEVILVGTWYGIVSGRTDIYGRTDRRTDATLITPEQTKFVTLKCKVGQRNFREKTMQMYRTTDGVRVVIRYIFTVLSAITTVEVLISNRGLY